MSVDFKACDCCEESRYEEHVGRCSKCGHSLCTNCLINDDIDSSYAHDYGIRFDGSNEQKEEYGVESKEESDYGYEIGEILDDVGIDSKYCPFCGGEEIHNDDLLGYLLSKLNIGKEDLIKEYNENKGGK